MSRGYNNRECRDDCSCSCRSNYCNSSIPSCCGEDRFGFFNKYGYGTGNNSFLWIIIIVIFVFFILGRNDGDED